MSRHESFAARTVFWKRCDVAGLERCTLSRMEGGASFDGVVLLERPLLEVRYSIACDRAWHTREVDVRLRESNGEERRLTLSVDDAQRWRRDGVEAPELHGLIDVDLMITPATNTLPLRRLELEIGASTAVTAAWVRFPELTIRPFEQRYMRLAIDRFRYESPSFAADLLVDEVGLVRRYGDVWARCDEPS